MKPKAVIFDMDGLLFDTETLYYQANQKAADQFGLPFSQEYYMKFLGLSDEELHQQYRRDFADFGESVIAEFIAAGYAELQQMIDTTGAALKPGARELVNLLEEKQIPKVIASSNLRWVIDLLLDHAGLVDRFKAVISCEDVKLAKPDPEIVEVALRLLRTKPEDTLMLEDSLNGIRAASAAGVPVIMVPDLIAADDEARKKTVAVLPDLFAVKKFIQL